jgi:hypothetical protein
MNKHLSSHKFPITSLKYLIRGIKRILGDLKLLVKKLLSTRKSRLIALGAIVLILVPIVVFTLLNLRDTQAAWSTLHREWKTRQRVPITNNSGASLSAETTIAITIDTKELVETGKLNTDCSDLRVLYQPNDQTSEELPRHLSYPGGQTCATSETTKVSFSLKASLSNNATTSHYYLYYANPQATTPTDDLTAYNIGEKQALLICPFNGTTQCINGNGPETPTTETGAIRYSGAKSAISLDGINDYIDAGSETIIDDLTVMTVETWIKMDDFITTPDWYMIAYKTAPSDQGWALYAYSPSANTTRIFCGKNFSTTSAVSWSTDVFSTLNDGDWHHIACTYDNYGDRYTRIYLNGTEVSYHGTRTSSVGTLVSEASGNLRLGSRSQGDHNSRLVYDEFRLSNTIRYMENFTPSTLPLTRDESTLILYHFDETGDDPRNTGKAIDNSGNGNHGTITGAKYVAGLVGVDNGTTDTGKSDSQTYASHEGIFIEEGTTNKITNPSFEHDVFNTDWSFRIAFDTPVATVSGTSTVTHPTRYGRKTWHDGTRYWASWDTGSDIVFYYSTDGTSWSQNTSATITTQRTNFYSVWANDTDAYLVKRSNSTLNDAHDVSIRKASSYPGTSFSWGTEYVVFDGSSSTNSYYNPSMAVDSNGRVWVVAHHLNDPGGGNSMQAYARRSTNTNDISSWDTAIALGENTTGTSHGSQIVALDSGNMYAFWVEGSALRGCFYDNQTDNRWETSGGSACTGSTYDTIDADASVGFYAVADNDNYDVHLAFQQSNTPLNKISYRRWDNSSGTNGTWQSTLNIENTSSYEHRYPNITLDTLTNDLHISWVDSTNGVLYLNHCQVAEASSNCDILADWSSKSSIHTGLTGTNSTFLNTNREGDGRVFGIFRDGTTSPYDVYFKIIYLNQERDPVKNTDPAFVKFGASSAKLVATDESIFSTVITNSNTHTLSAYVYDGTDGSVGGTVDAGVASLVFNGEAKTTTYSDTGGGWWRLSYTETGAETPQEYGIKIETGKTIYLDGVQLEEKSTVTTYTDGSLGDGYSWSGTAHESTSSRVIGNITYPHSGNISKTSGSISLWVKSPHLANTNLSSASYNILWIRSGGTGYELQYNGSTWGNNFTFTKWLDYSTNLVIYKSKTFSRDQWMHLVVTWNTTEGTKLYVNNDTPGTHTNLDEPSAVGSIILGGVYGGTIWNYSDLRIYDSALTSTEIADLYYSGLVSRSQSYEVDRFGHDNEGPVAIWKFDESSGTTAHDSSPFGNHLTVSNTTWNTQSVGANNQRVRNLSFNGVDSFASRTANLSSQLNVGTGEFSLSGFIRAPSKTIASNQFILAKHQEAGYGVYLNTSGQLCFGIDDDSTWTPDDTACTTTAINDSSWYHFTATKTSSGIYLYLNGTKVAEDTTLSATATLNNSSPFYLGAFSSTSGFFEGWLDDIVIYNYARSEDEIKTDLAGNRSAAVLGTQSTDPSRKGWWGIGRWMRRVGTEQAGR